MASMEELLRYLESFMHGQINQSQQPQGQQQPFGGQPAGPPAGEMQGGVAHAAAPSGGVAPEPGVMQGGVATNPMAQPPSELAGATPEEVQMALQQFTELHPELAPYLALAGNEPLNLAGAVGQLGGIPSEALGGYVPAFGPNDGEFSARIAEPGGTDSGFSPAPGVVPSGPGPDFTSQAAPLEAAAGEDIGSTIADFFTGAGQVAAGAGQLVGDTLAGIGEPPAPPFGGGPTPIPTPYPNVATPGDAGAGGQGDPGFAFPTSGTPVGQGDPGFTLPSGGTSGGLGDPGFTFPSGAVPEPSLGDVFGGLPDFGAEQVGEQALGAFPGAIEEGAIAPPDGGMSALGQFFGDTGAAEPSAPSPVNLPAPDSGAVGGSGIPGDPTGGGDGQFSSTSSVTVEPTFVEGDPIGGDDQPAMTISGGGPAIDDGVSAGVADGLSDGASSVGGDLGGGIDLSGVSDVVGDVASSGIPIGAAAGAAYDLADGNYTGAAEEGVIGGLDVGAAALGLPGVDSDISVLNDLVDGNTGAIAGDAETAAIATGAGILGGAAGSLLGPVGTVAGAAIGSFVGQAVAPAVKDAASDTYDTGRDVLNDTTTSLSDAGSALEEGNVFGAVGDVTTGAVDDVGDVATGAADLVGDAAEGVGDVVSAVGGVADDIGSGIDDVANDIGDVF